MSPKRSEAYYDKELLRLQSEVAVLQEWIRHTGLRAIVVVEGRDGVQNSEVIKAITAQVCPRVFRVIALPEPSDRERQELYFQRYVRHFPAAGEVVVFDGSWYRRAIEEYVMGTCTLDQHRKFLKQCPLFERLTVEDGICLIKYWLEINDQEYRRRLEARKTSPSLSWKLSPLELHCCQHWYDHSRARDIMFSWTDIDVAPWHILQMDDQKRSILNCISHLLSLIPYQTLHARKIKVVSHSKTAAYNDQATIRHCCFVPETY